MHSFLKNYNDQMTSFFKKTFKKPVVIKGVIEVSSSVTTLLILRWLLSLNPFLMIVALSALFTLRQYYPETPKVV